MMLSYPLQVQSGPVADRLKEKYTQQVAEAEDQTRVLKDKQKEIKVCGSTVHETGR